jgi:hypothetical protein
MHVFKNSLRAPHTRLCSLPHRARPPPAPRREELDEALLPLARLPAPVPQPGEMDDVCWFHRDWLRAATAAAAAAAAPAAASSDGSGDAGPGPAPPAFDAGPGTAVDYGGFDIPGGYSLAHRLITGWLREDTPEPWAGDALPQARSSRARRHALHAARGAQRRGWQQRPHPQPPAARRSMPLAARRRPPCLTLPSPTSGVPLLLTTTKSRSASRRACSSTF